MLPAQMFVYIKYCNNESNANLCSQDPCVDVGHHLKNSD